MNKDNGFRVISYSKELIEYINSLIVNYPKKEMIIKDRLLNESYEILELIYFANLVDEKIKLQKTVLTKVSMIDFYLEQSYKRKYISEKQLNKVVRILENITKMTYGWIRSEECFTK